MKLATYIHTVYDAEPGFAEMRFPFSALMQKVMAKYPGCRWSGHKKCWLVPNELASGISKYAGEHLGWLQGVNASEAARFIDEVNKAAYEFQREDILSALAIRRAILAWEMGLGKTLGGIEFIRLSKSKKTLVVCPAMARSVVWEDDLVKWWPEHPEIITLRDGKAADNFVIEHSHKDAWICIISYELLKKLRFDKKFDCIIADESHYIKDKSAGRSKALQQIVERFNIEYRLFLTGTPITVNPIDIHNQVECLYPGRLGNFWKFADTYCGKVTNIHSHKGFDYVGVNSFRAEELYTRLNSFIFRRTKAEVADQLPPLITQTIRLKPNRDGQKAIDAALKSNGDLEAAIVKASSHKVDSLINMAKEDFESGATHLCFLTYFQASADELAGKMREALDVHVIHVDGTTPEKKRSQLIADAKKMERCIFVATMKSVNVGINLTKFSPAYFAELYSAPGIMSQAAGRFHRVGGESSKALIRFVVLEGTEEERIANVLEKRMREHGKVIAKGHVDKAIMSALEEETESPAEFLKRVRAAMANSREEDVYA